MWLEWKCWDIYRPSWTCKERIRMGKQMEKDGEKVPQLKKSHSSGFARSYHHILWIQFHPTSSHAEWSRSKVKAKDPGVGEVRSWFDKNEVTCAGRALREPGDSRWFQALLGLRPSIFVIVEVWIRTCGRCDYCRNTDRFIYDPPAN